MRFWVKLQSLRSVSSLQQRGLYLYVVVFNNKFLQLYVLSEEVNIRYVFSIKVS